MITIVGEATGPQPGVKTQTSRRLAELCGVDYNTFVTRTNWVNLFDNPNAPPEVISRMVEQKARIEDGIILLGRKVAHEFLLGDKPPLFQLARNAGRGPVILLLPHTSGLNRWWNEQSNIDATSDILRRLWEERG